MSDDAIHIKIIILFTDVFAKPEQDFDSVVVNCIFFEKTDKKTQLNYTHRFQQLIKLGEVVYIIWIFHWFMNFASFIHYTRSTPTYFKPLSANPTKWSNTLNQFISNLAICQIPISFLFFRFLEDHINNLLQVYPNPKGA